MKKSLQEQYLLIKEGKGHKDVFMKEAKKLLPNQFRNAATFEEIVGGLKHKNVIHENIIGLEAINQLTPSNKESFEVAFEKFLKESQEEAEKAELKNTSKQVEKDLSKNFDREDKSNPDNLIFDQIMKGYYTEMCDPKNEGKTAEQIKSVVFKNLEKNPTYYTEKGQFGIKDLGYTTEAPGLGTPKEPKGPHKSSGYGALNEDHKPGDKVIYKGTRYEVVEEDETTITLKDEKGNIITKNYNQFKKGEYKGDVKEQSLRKVIREIVNSELNKTYYINESKQEQLLRKVIRESVEKEIAAINKEAELEILDTKLEKINSAIEKRQSQLTRLDEDEDMKALTDKNKVKQIQKDIKTLEKVKAKIEKQLSKKDKVKKEVIDEDEPVEESLDDQKISKVKGSLEDIDSTMDSIKDKTKDIFENEQKKINSAIEKRQSQLTRLDEDEDMKALTDKIKDEAIKKKGNTFLKFLQKNNIDYTFTMDSITTPGLTEVILKDFDNMIISYDYKDNFIEIKYKTKDIFENERELPQDILNTVVDKFAETGGDEDMIPVIAASFPTYEKEIIEFLEGYDLGLDFDI